jgi:succinyl-CoA synthetase beta subunit
VLQAAGVPCYEWPDRTARAVGHAVGYAARRGDIHPPPAGPPPAEATLPPGPLSAARAAALLADHGVATVATAACTSRVDAVAAADDLGYPVVCKTAASDVAHRTERGGVHLGLADADAVARAYDALSAIAGQVLVQPQLDGVELAVGAVRDERFGPAVMVGLGGTAVEVLDDVAFALAPVHDAEVADLLDGLRGTALLDGHRGAPAVDRGAVCALVRSAGDVLVAHPEVAEIDLNPVLARPDRAVAVDWKITVGVPSDGVERRAAGGDRLRETSR